MDYVSNDTLYNLGLIAIAVLVWWSITVIVFMAIDTRSNPRETTHRIAVAAFWPLIAFGILIISLWEIPYPTTQKIRSGLHNRGVLKEFDAWLDARNAQNIEPINDWN